MRKNRKILIIGIILALVGITFLFFKIGTVEKIETLSKNANETKYKTNNENTEESLYEEGKAIIVYESNNLFTKLKVDTISLFNNYEIENTIELGKLEKDKSEMTAAIVNSDQYSTEELVKELNKKKWVISAIPNYEFKVTSLTNDEYADIQWSLQNNGHFGGKTGNDINPITTYSEKEKVIAIIDTGVDYTNEDLANVMWKNPYDEETLPGTCGYDFVNEDNDPMDDQGHGTFCAGIIAAESNNGIGISGAVLGASNIKIMALKVGDADGTMNLNNIISAYNYIFKAQQLGVNIVAINNSWGVLWDLEVEDAETIEKVQTLFNQIVRQTGEKGAISVFAAGNNGIKLDEKGVFENGAKSYLAFPACLENDYEITVTATNSNGELAYFSNYGDTVDVAAPGVDIYSTYLSGCSFNPTGNNKEEYNLYENFEEEFSDVQDGFIPYIVDIRNNKSTFKDGSSIYSSEITNEKFYGNSGKSLKITVDNSNGNNNVFLRFPLNKLGITDLNTYAISLNLFVTKNTDSLGKMDANCGYSYNGECIVTLQDESAEFSYDLEYMKICDSDYWHHCNSIYSQKDYFEAEYLDIMLINLGEGEYTIYIDDFVITNDLEDNYMSVLTPYELQSGTSMAAPHVTASVAVATNQYENYNAKEIKDLILQGTRNDETFEGIIKYGELDMQSLKLRLGDANADGNVDLNDILSINKHRLNKIKLQNNFFIAGDVNEDGNIDIRDILRINKFRLGIINEL